MNFNIEKDPVYAEVAEQLEIFYKRVDEKIAADCRRVEASRKKSEQESKLVQEQRLCEELSARLSAVQLREGELSRVCAALGARLAGPAVPDGDRSRLQQARDLYQLAKELTGVRLDYSTPPHVARGYIKNESRKLMETFEIDMQTSGASDALWARVAVAAGAAPAAGGAATAATVASAASVAPAGGGSTAAASRPAPVAACGPVAASPPAPPAPPAPPRVRHA